MCNWVSIFSQDGPLENHSKWNTDGTMKTESFRGKITFFLNSASFSFATDSGQRLGINFVWENQIFFCRFLHFHIQHCHYILDIPKISRDNHEKTVLRETTPKKDIKEH